MLTVLMATYNGARTLLEVLNAYCKLDSPKGGWKLIIVDNASTDSTKDVVSLFTSRLPVTYIFEPQSGKSVALNTGLLNVSGDLVIMTDDDAVPRPDWLVQMRDAADSQPSFGVFGGAIVPRWEVLPEEWILPFWSVLTLTGPDWEEGPTVMARVSGPNMAVRSDLIRAGFRFDTSLGPVGSRYRMGEDTDFVQRLGKAGIKAWHCKHAIVEHIIRKNQMNRKWMLRRARKLGCAHYQWESKEYSIRPPVLFLGIPRYIIREILGQAIRALSAWLTQGKNRAYQERWQFEYLIGRAMGGQLAHNSKKPLVGQRLVAEGDQYLRGS